jgi:hypothetical protein
MHAKRILTSCFVVCAMGTLLVANAVKEASSGAVMADAANAFLKTLSDSQREQATFGFNDKERLNWHFIPRERKGIPLRDLEGKALASAKTLIAGGLSDAGYDQTVNVMSLEEVLFLFEGGKREQRRERRDPKKYYLSIFGKPSNSGTWGWRLEGHHISLNYTISNGQVVSSTPEFFGANPGTIEAGPGRTLRVLGPEEDIARQILKLCSEQQKAVAWISKEAPNDLRGGGVAQPVLDKTGPVGLSASKMSKDQKRLLRDLLAEYLKNMPADIERQRRSEINKAGHENLYFSWWGSSERNERHYYRVQGPTFIIEYNNTQNSANHVHSIWRNIAGDFNISL